MELGELDLIHFPSLGYSFLTSTVGIIYSYSPPFRVVNPKELIEMVITIVILLTFPPFSMKLDDI